MTGASVFQSVLYPSRHPDELLIQWCELAAIGGILSHLLYFIYGIRDLQVLKFIAFFILAQCFVVTMLFSSLNQQIFGTLCATIGIDTAYFGGLSFSMIIYRLFFHRLQSFPGPLAAKMSKTFYGLYMSRNVKYHEELQKLHRQYGDIVRVGPNELSITSVDGLRQIHGPESKCRKGPAYWVSPQNIGGIADKSLHKIRRRPWEQAFTTKALTGYELHTRLTIRDWFSKLESLQGSPLNISLYSMLISFDNMGRVGYSKEWGVIKAGHANNMLSLLEVLTRPSGKLGRVTWLKAVGFQLKLSKEFREFEKLSKETMDIRENEDVKGDIAEHLLAYHRQADHNGVQKPGATKVVHDESGALLIAATDTVANVLTWAFYYLAKDSSLKQKLRTALEPIYQQEQSDSINSSLSGVKLLNAIINETMRLRGSIPVGGSRLTPSEGIRVGDVWIPGDVTIFTPGHVMHRSESYFKRPDEFIPERWTTERDLIIDEKAFSPFLLGPFGCVGKQLALMELRMVLAETVWNYEFHFAPGETGSTIENESLDLGIYKAAPLNLVFKKRV